jgi:hypothetical protein
MIGTLQALLVAVIVVLPGALYTIARENHGASWAWRGTDGATLVFRFLAFSAVFHAVFVWLTYWAYQELVVTDDLYDGKPISWWWYLAVLAYMAIPYLWGVLVEKQRRTKFIEQALRRKYISMVLRWKYIAPCWGKISRLLLWWRSDSPPELRAWDFLFSKRQVGVVRLRLTNDEWKAGLWANSFASSYGEEGDLYLAEQYFVDKEGVIRQDANGDYVSGGAGLLIRWSEVRYLEFSEWSPPPKPPAAP